MNKYLKRCLEESIKRGFVSVYHDYDKLETVYSIPYDATITPNPVKEMLVKVMGLVDDEDIDEQDSKEINETAMFLIREMMPEFSISSRHIINKHNVLMTQYTLDFDGMILYEKAYPSDKLGHRNPMLNLMRQCSNKVVSQERFAQKHKMEKMFISMNMFTLCEQHGRK